MATSALADMKTVNVDMNTGTVKDAVPFDERFSSGRASATLTADANTNAGDIRIIVTTPSDSGGTLTSELTLKAQ
jgi:hypothetical protein